MTGSSDLPEGSVTFLFSDIEGPRAIFRVSDGETLLAASAAGTLLTIDEAADLAILAPVAPPKGASVVAGDRCQRSRTGECLHIALGLPS